MKIKVKFPNGELKEIEKGKNAQELFPSLKIFAVKINGILKDS